MSPAEMPGTLLMNKYYDSNRDMWDDFAELHKNSEFYDLDGFRAGKSTLYDFELADLGDVAGKSLLHLQCHFGLDTLSFARLGAKVTGADFSPKAIRIARSIAEELSIDARFIESEVHRLPENLDDSFDIVYTSAGVLCWLKDLKGWGKVAAHFVKPGGFFYIREFHPFAHVFDDESEPTEKPRLRYPYFPHEKPMRFDDPGSYASKNDPTVYTSYEWSHPMSEIVNSLTNAGLTIESLNEFNFNTYNSHPWLKQSEDGFWRYPDMEGGMPLMFSIRARKPLA